MKLQFACMLVLLVSGVGCSPTFNWREVRQDGAPINMMLPCKPDMGQRELPLIQGQSHMVQMVGCKTGGYTFAIAWADVRQPSLANAALMAWRSATLDQLHVRTRTDSPVNISGVGTQHPTTLIRVAGATTKGEQVAMEGVWFTKGSYVFQAMIVGDKAADQVTEPFFSGLTLP
jgi:hypothetical protein